MWGGDIAAWTLSATLALFRASGVSDVDAGETAADAACLAEVQTLFDPGGASDPFARPPHHLVQVTTDAQGVETIRSELRVETPLRTMANFNESCTLVVGAKYWTGPCWSGPWEAGPNTLNPNREDELRATLAQRRANVSDAACPGLVPLNGQSVMFYRYRTRTDMAADQTYSGGLYSIWVDPKHDRWVKLQVTDIVNPWQMEPNGETVTTEFRYDPGLRVAQPIEGAE